MRLKRAVLTTVLTGVSALLLNIGPAMAVEEPTVEIQSAELVAGGAKVLVTVDVTCGPFETPSYQEILDVRVSQRVGNGIVNGGGSTTIDCDGETHTYQVTVSPFPSPYSSGRPFKRGTAFVTASTNIYNSGVFYRTTDEETVKIR